MKRAPLFLSLAALLSLSCASTANRLVISNVTVIDATGALARNGMDVVIEGNRIAAITPAGTAPRGTRVIDGTGKYLIPGLWDMHTHLSFYGEEALLMNVRHGVLAVRDLGGSLEQLDGWNAEIERGTRVGPRIFPAGPYLDGPREYGDDSNQKLRRETTVTVSTPEEGRAAVASLKQKGVDTIKTHNSLSKESLLAIIAECRRLNIPLAVHPASRVITIEEVSDAGPTTLEHIEMLTESMCYANIQPDGKPMSPLAALDAITDEKAMELFSRFARNGSAYDPNLVAYRTFMQEAVDLAPKDPRYENAAKGRTKMFNRFIEYVGLMKRAGVVVVTGTDSGVRPETVPYPVSIPGSDLHDEMKLFVQGGLTPLEALQSATMWPARLLRVADRLGTIEVGKEADLVLLSADPLANIENTRKIDKVIARGAVVELPPPALVVEGAPPVPATLIDEIKRYTKGRSAVVLHAWHPQRRELLVTSRSAETHQIHRVAAPHGARTQLTFAGDGIDQGISYDPRGRFILFNRDRGGDGNHQIYRLDAATGAVTCITDGKSLHGPAVWSQSGDRIAYASTRRTGRDADLYVVDPSRPETDRLLAKLEGAGWTPLDWSPDDRRIAVLQTVSVARAAIWLADAESGAMQKLALPEAYYSQGAFTADGKTLITVSDAQSDFRELIAVDVSSGAMTRLTPHIPWDVVELDLAPDGRLAAIVTNEAGAYTLHLIDVTSGHERALPSNLPAGWVTQVRWHPNGRELGFNIDSARAPLDVYSLDLASGNVTRWTESGTGGADTSSFADAQSIRWKSFDGLEISGFLYRPPKRFTGKRPVLISVHGGPEDQFTPYYLGRWNHVLNDLGVALLYPNIRGSSGFGKRFLTLDDGMRREDALRDIDALLDWIAQRPDLDATRVMITGFSYGGYVALSTAVRQSDRIRGAIDIVGPSSLVSFLENTAPYRRDLRRVEYGDERDPAMRAFLQQLSPLDQAARIKKPLMVVQGRNDPAVPVREARQIADAVRSNGTPVWFVLAEDEGHGFSKRANADYQFYLTVLFIRRFLLGS